MVTFLDAAHHLHRVVPISRWTPVLGLAALLLCLLLWRRLAGRFGWRPVPTLLALLSLAGALAMTLAPRGWWGNHKSLAQCLPSDWSQVAGAVAKVGGNLESLLNVAMLVPFGVTLVLASRRVVWPALLVALLPAGIEMVQTVIPGRQCSPTDYFANALGGLLGVAAGALVDRWWRGRERPAESAAQPPAAFTSS
jgi:MFS family permease